MSSENLTSGSNPLKLAYDIGGSHVTAALVDSTGNIFPSSRAELSVNPGGTADEVLAAWATAGVRAASTVSRGTRSPTISGVGIAMPGPFDYDGGVSLMQGVAKFESLYGLNVRTELKGRLALTESCPMIFRNDAHCFLLGESRHGAARGFDNVIGITLGTGFGSAFMRAGNIIETGPGVPPNGWLYNAPFDNTIADECFSTRGLMRLLPSALSSQIADGKQLAGLAQTDPSAHRVFETFGARLAAFITPWLQNFHAQCLIIGGSLSRAWDLFSPSLIAQLRRRGVTAEPKQSILFDDAALLGASVLPDVYKEGTPAAVPPIPSTTSSTPTPPEGT